MADQKFVQCVSCQGVYQRIQADGTEYYHACPSRRVVGSKPAPTAADPKATVPVFAPILNPRNENVVVDPTTSAATIISAGGGVVDVAAPVFVNPEVV